MSGLVGRLVAWWRAFAAYFGYAAYPERCGHHRAIFCEVCHNDVWGYRP